MKTMLRIRFAMVITVAVMLMLFSGCIKRTSEPLVEEADFWPVTEKIALSNPIGTISVTGDSTRLLIPMCVLKKRSNV